MCRKLFFVSTCILLVCHSAVNGQQFLRRTLESGLLHQYGAPHYGGGVSFYDFNKDGWDDLSLPDDNLNCRFFRNNGDGTLELLEPFFPPEEGGKVKQINWVDFDNDGDADLSLSVYEGRFRLYENDGNFNFSEISAVAGFPDTQNETFGHSWGDYNRDGWLDVYICNYDYFNTDVTNYLYRNNGDGTFSDVSIETGTDNGSNFSFMGAFGDYNNDGWSDLFVINDRSYSRDYMYRNNGGTFSDETESLNLDYYIYSMSNSWADYDNDGDFDIYITNGMAGNLLHRNENAGEYFTEVAVQAGVVQYDFSFAANWLDYDLDGWLDLQVCVKPFWLNPGQNRFYRNNGDGTFSNLTESIGIAPDHGRWSHGAAWGDINNDGHPDYCVNNDFPYLSDLWLNSGNSGNNYLKISLEGVISNRDGIGSLIEIWAGGMSQRRYTMTGESYLSQPSARNIFGLGQNQQVDSIRISWLSGHVDHFYNISVNQTLHILEGSSLSIDLGSGVVHPLCGNAAILEATGYATYEWSNGQTDSSIIVVEPGAYWLNATTSEGIIVHSDTIYFETAQPPQTEVMATAPSCPGSTDGSIELIIDNPYPTYPVSIVWENGVSGNFLDGVADGWQVYTLHYGNGCVIADSVGLFAPPLVIPEMALTGISCYGANDGSIAFPDPEGDGILAVIWSDGISGTSRENLAAGEYGYSITFTNNCIATGSSFLPEPEAFVIQLQQWENASGDTELTVSVDGGTAPFTFLWSNGETGDSATYETAGDFWLLVTDANGCEEVYPFEIESATSHPVQNATRKFGIFPNPGGDFTVLSGQLIVGTGIDIYSAEGSFLRRHLVESDSFEIIDFKGLADGIYILKLSDGEVFRYVKSGNRQ